MSAPDETEEHDLVERLRRGDEQAFALLLDRYYRSMLHVARGYVSSVEAAEDVVQDAFLGVITGIGKFEGRSSLRTWLFKILVNRAQTRGEREGRVRPFSSIVDGGEPSVGPERFEQTGRWAGYWSAPPSARDIPEGHVLSDEMGARLLAAVDSLPAAQRTVLELRDVLGFSSSETCELLGLTEVNQRVLLHRGRSKARTFLESYVFDQVAEQ